MRLFQIYAAGNFIEATEDTPFLQIGEHKYGKPILDRAARYDTAALRRRQARARVDGFDAALQSHRRLADRPPGLREDALKIERPRRITEDDPYFRMIRERWSTALREAFQSIPRPSWE